MCEKILFRLKREGKKNNHEKKKIIPLAKEEEHIHKKKKVSYICRKPFSDNSENRKYRRVRDHYNYTGKYRGDAHDICNLRYHIPREVSVVFHNGPKYDYHFIIKELAETFEGELCHECHECHGIIR